MKSNKLKTEDLGYCKDVIHHTCKHFMVFGGCTGCRIKEYKPRNSDLLGI